MPTMNSYRWEQEVLGERAVYPGHPVILACIVMDRYPDLDTAVRREPGRAFGNALSDNFIPGTGCAVQAALDTLRYGQEQGLNAAYSHAERYWLGWEQQHPSNAPWAAKGRNQCEHIKTRFADRLKTWSTPTDPGSPYRSEEMVTAAS